MLAELPRTGKSRRLEPGKTRRQNTTAAACAFADLFFAEFQTDLQTTTTTTRAKGARASAPSSAWCCPPPPPCRRPPRRRPRLDYVCSAKYSRRRRQRRRRRWRWLRQPPLLPRRSKRAASSPPSFSLSLLLSPAVPRLPRKRTHPPFTFAPFPRACWAWAGRTASGAPREGFGRGAAPAPANRPLRFCKRHPPSPPPPPALSVFAKASTATPPQSSSAASAERKQQLRDRPAFASSFFPKACRSFANRWRRRSRGFAKSRTGRDVRNGRAGRLLPSCTLSWRRSSRRASCSNCPTRTRLCLLPSALPLSLPL
jgi:hypothetical protein